MNNAQVTPTTAAMVFPTIIFQGCARGLAGTANSNTEDAPIGAIYQALKSPRIHKLSNEDTAKPIRAPMPHNRRSLSGRTLKFGFKVLSQSRFERNTVYLIYFLSIFRIIEPSSLKGIFVLYLLMLQVCL